MGDTNGTVNAVLATREAYNAAIQAHVNAVREAAKAVGRKEALAEAPALTGISLTAVDDSRKALADLVIALKSVGATHEAEVADRAYVILSQVGKALTSTAPAPAPALTGLDALGKAAPSATGATPTATATAPANGATPRPSASPASEPRVEPVTAGHATDAEVDSRLAKFHNLRSHYLKDDGTPRVKSRVAKLDEWYSEVSQGLAPTAYVAPEGAAPWPNAAEVAKRIVALFD